MNAPFSFRRFVKNGLALCRLPQTMSDGVLLTFDDGPHPEVTPEVMDRLDAYSARAILFVVGNRIERAPGLLSAAAGRGHLLGNHTFSHPNDRDLWPLECLRDLRRCQELIYRNAGVRARFYRPPRGSFAPGFVIAPRIAGLRTINWSLEARDWRCRTRAEAEAAAETLVSGLSGGDIVLLHDDNELSLILLDRLLPEISRRGLRIIDPAELT